MMSVCLRRGLTAVVVAFALSAPVTHAAVILFSDNFDGDAAGSVLNFTGFANWTVVGGSGTVDYIRSGDFGISCAGGVGGCVDTDGSTNNSGRMLSNSTFSFVVGETYRLFVDVSGSQRGGRDELSFGLVGPGAVSTSMVLDSSDPFTTESVGYAPGSGFAGSYQIFIEGSSNDNVGPIIDNVRLECLTCGNNTQVPEPGALALLGIGAAGALALRRRNRQA